jgi:hypothetical protein
MRRSWPSCCTEPTWCNRDLGRAHLPGRLRGLNDRTAAGPADPLRPWPPALASRRQHRLAILSVLALAAGTLLARFPSAGVGEWSPQLIAAGSVAPVGGHRLPGPGRASVGRWRPRSAQRPARDLRRAMVGVRPAEPCRAGRPRGAFATPASGGRIVASTGMLRALRGRTSRPLAHGSSHVRHRHYWWVAAAQLSAAMFPLLRPPPGRWPHRLGAGPTRTRPTTSATGQRWPTRWRALRPATPVPGAVAATKGPVARVEALLSLRPVGRGCPPDPGALVAVSLLTAWLVAQGTDASSTGPRSSPRRPLWTRPAADRPAPPGTHSCGAFRRASLTGGSDKQLSEGCRRLGPTPGECDETRDIGVTGPVDHGPEPGPTWPGMATPSRCTADRAPDDRPGGRVRPGLFCQRAALSDFVASLQRPGPSSFW